MNQKLFTICIPAWLFAFLGCVFAQEEINWIKHTTDNFEISYPKTWDINKTGVMGTAFVISSPQSSSNDIFRENTNLLVIDLSARNLDLQEFVKLSETQVKQMLTNSKIISSKRVQAEPHVYHHFIYTGVRA